jgi:hypothetical protein
MLLPGFEVVGLRSTLSEACELAPDKLLAAEKLGWNTKWRPYMRLLFEVPILVQQYIRN